MAGHDLWLAMPGFTGPCPGIFMPCRGIFMPCQAMGDACHGNFVSWAIRAIRVMCYYVPYLYTCHICVIHVMLARACAIGPAHEHLLMGQAHEHILMGQAHEHMPMDQTHEHMLRGPSQDAGKPNWRWRVTKPNPVRSANTTFPPNPKSRSGGEAEAIF